MLKFRLVNLIFLFLAAALAFSQLHPLFWLLLVSAWLGVITNGVVNIRSGFFVKVISQGKTKAKEVMLSFDDGPEPAISPLVLDLLHAKGIKACFFCIGKKMEAEPETVRRILNEGHCLGNHSYHHRNSFPVQSSAAIRKEILDTRKIIEGFSGREAVFFRPPFGITNPLLSKALQGLEIKVVGWTIRSFDLSNRPAEKIVDRVISKLRPGAILLFHDSSPKILTILPLLLERLQQKGWEVVPPGQFLLHSALPVKE